MLPITLYMQCSALHLLTNKSVELSLIAYSHSHTSRVWTHTQVCVASVTLFMRKTVVVLTLIILDNSKQNCDTTEFIRV